MRSRRAAVAANAGVAAALVAATGVAAAGAKITSVQHVKRRADERKT